MTRQSANTTTEPSTNTLSLEEKALLLSGRDFWSTAPAPGVPSIVMVDGPHGVRRQEGTADNLGFNDSLPATCFPPGTALGSSWDPDLVEEVGKALGREAAPSRSMFSWVRPSTSSVPPCAGGTSSTSPKIPSSPESWAPPMSRASRAKASARQ